MWKSLVLAVSLLCLLKTGVSAEQVKAGNEIRPLTKRERKLDWIRNINSLEPRLVTPHTKFAKPYAEGQSRVLFILGTGPVNSAALRRAAELMQRFDVTGDSALASERKEKATDKPGSSGVLGGDLGEQRLARLLEKEYDGCVVWADLFPYLPLSAQSIILDRVKGGAGLVLLYGKEDGDYLAGAKPIGDLPEMLGGTPSKAYELGQGRVLLYSPARFDIYHMKSRLSLIFGLEVPRDYQFEEMGRAVLWAVRKEPAVELTISLAAEKFARQDLQKNVVSVNWQSEEISDALSITGRIRSQGRGSVDLFSIDSQEPSEGRKDYRLPLLPQGEYWIDVIARSSRGVESWAVKRLFVEGAVSPTVTLRKDYGEAGEKIVGAVSLSGQPRKGCGLSIRAIDRYGRILVQKNYPVKKGEMGFSLPTAEWMPGWLGVEVAYLEDGQPVSYAYTFYTIPHRKHDKFHWIMWGRMYIWEFDDIAEDAMAEAGVTSRIETSRIPWWYMSRAGMNFVTFGGGALERFPDMGPQVPLIKEDNFCWNDLPAVHENVLKPLKEGHSAEFYKRGVFLYDMADEPATRRSCLHPKCLEAYRGYLRDQYGGIQALNRSWGTSFKDFSQIEPRMDDSSIPWVRAKGAREYHQLNEANSEMSCLRPHSGSRKWDESWINYPRWFDRQAFQYWNWAKHMERLGQTLKALDPQAKCGVECTIDSGVDNIDLIVRHTDFWMPYEFHVNEIIRAIAPKGYFFGVRNGIDWPSFLRGCNAGLSWRVDNQLSLQLDVRGLPSTMDRAAHEKARRMVVDGFGDLLNIHSTIKHDGIAVLHSFPSAQASKFNNAYGVFQGRNSSGGSLKEKGSERNDLAFTRMIRSMGLAYKYVTDGQMDRGEFDASEYKVLILPQCEAISETTAEVIRDFVEDGGTVIADVRPGIYNGRCKPQSPGMLDDVFGVKHLASADPVTKTAHIKNPYDESAGNIRAMGLQANPGIRLAGGKPLAKNMPLFIVNRFGKGKALLLNCAIWSYGSHPVRGEMSTEKLNLFKGVLREAGIQWPFTLIDGNEKPYEVFHAVRWDTGEGQEVVALLGPLGYAYFGFGWEDYIGRDPNLKLPFKSIDEPLAVKVRFSRPVYVTEVGTGRETDEAVSEFTTSAVVNVPTFMVLSDKKLDGPQISLTRADGEFGQEVKLRVSVPDTAGLHAVKIRVTTPDGQRAKWFDRTLMVGPEGAETVLHVAQNEQAGSWSVTATDLYNSKTATCEF